jgi:flagellar export protein FliJ
MTKWAHSLIRISTYEVETLQKRLAEITARRVSAEMRVTTLDAEYAVERERARDDAEALSLLPAYAAAWKYRREAAQAQVDAVVQEEQGAREALAQAFEAQKKFEHVAEMSRLQAVAEAGKREAAMLDELAIQRSAG